MVRRRTVWNDWSRGKYSQGEQFGMNGPEVNGQGVNSLERLVQGEWSSGEHLKINS